MIQAGIIGGTGYTAGELIRILINHPDTEINFVHSSSKAGKQIYEVHQDLIGEIDIKFTDVINPDVDAVFLCLGHGNSRAFLEKHNFSLSTKIIDLSNDFRLADQATLDKKYFIYGLPELNREKIKTAKYIANPGCFATAIQLALLPLAHAGTLQEEVHIHAVTGSTGAGKTLSETAHFSWRSNNFSYYKPFTHQHLDEIRQNLQSLQPGFTSELNLLPFRGDFSRGIFATLYTYYEGSLEQAKNLYQDFYKEAAFTFLSEEQLCLKQVVNTNKCFVHLHKHEDKLLIACCLDNLLKGASGQAVQNMNLMFGFPEQQGLKLKANYF